jgi:gliding motility-associated-like protein
MASRLAIPFKHVFRSLAIAMLLALLLPVCRLHGEGVNEGVDAIVLQFAITPSTCGNANGSITITASNGTAPYTYSLDGVPGPNVIHGLTAGTYIVSVMDNMGLTASQSVVVQDIPGPTFTVNTLPATCANNDGSITVVPCGTCNGPFMYEINAQGFQTSPIFPNLSTGIMTFTIMDANSCTAFEPVDVPLNADLMLSVPLNLSECAGIGLILPAISNATVFSWTPVTGLDNPAALNPIATPATTTQYTLSVTKGICSSTSFPPLTLTVNPVPIAEAAIGTTICYGKSEQLQGSAQSPPGINLSYSWSPTIYLDNPNIQDPTAIQPQHTTTYQLQVTNEFGCSSVKPATETITVTKPPKVFAGDDTSVVVGQLVPLNAIDVDNIGFTQYQWTPAQGLSNASIQNPVATLSTPEAVTYVVVASTAVGCEAADSITIKSFPFADIAVPNAFTPNHDGHNDVLRALPRGIAEFKYFNVYSRWGQLVFSTSNEANGWDGTVNGKTQEPGVFVWIALGVDITGRVIERKGTVILLR